MKLIIGLGNPGKKYEQTWHNLGFLAIDALIAAKPEMFLKCEKSAKFKAAVCLPDGVRGTKAGEGSDLEEKVILAKPQTFMNKSGQSAKAIMSFYKIKPQNLWVVHDDIDLELGSLKISRNSSAAGHKGVQSIIDEINSREFVRFRLGIKPRHESRIPAQDQVLRKIGKDDKMIIDETIKEAAAAFSLALMAGVTEAMNEFN